MKSRNTRFGWNKVIGIPCKKQDLKELYDSYKLWRLETGAKLSFSSWISLVLIPKTIKRLNNNLKNKKRKDFI